MSEATKKSESVLSDMAKKLHIGPLLILKILGTLLVLALVAVFFTNSWFQTNAGYTYVYQNNFTGQLSVYTEPGVHFRVPHFSKVSEYKQVMTVDFGAETHEEVTAQKPVVNVRFADTYTGTIPAAFRFKLSSDPDKIIQMHREFRTFANLVESMLVKNARNVTVITATQYTGEEFFQGGLNQFKAKLEDQLRDGVYETERRQVEVEQIDLAPVGLEQSDSRKLQRSRQLVWKTVPIMGNDGKPLRQRNPLDQYGIQVTQVTVGDPEPENQLHKLLSDKKALVAERIKTIQEQETAKAQAKTEQLKKEIERTKAVQDVQRAKELAVIKETQAVEVAKQIAEKELVEIQKQKDIALVQKQKELEMAKANLEIQRANSEAAKFEALAILETGRAEAEVTKAKYAALGANKEIYLSEVQRDIAKVLYQNLRHFQVEMPKNYVSTASGNQDGLKTNLDVISAFSAFGLMEKAGEFAR